MLTDSRLLNSVIIINSGHGISKRSVSCQVEVDVTLSGTTSGLTVNTGHEYRCEADIGEAGCVARVVVPEI